MSFNLSEWVDTTEPGVCWNWVRARDRLGYGKKDGRQATRFVWKHLVGEIPEGLVLDHLCRNTSCVNPEHLEPVTQKVNIQRGVNVGKKLNVSPYCTSGHLYDAVGSDGRRYCHTCKRERTRLWRARKKEMAS